MDVDRVFRRSVFQIDERILSKFSKIIVCVFHKSLASKVSYFFGMNVTPKLMNLSGYLRQKLSNLDQELE